MRRVLVAGTAVLALALAAWVAVGLGAQAVTVSAHTVSPGTLRHARSPSVPRVLGGAPCYVSIARCSETPCTVFVGPAGAAVSTPAVAAVAVAPSRSSKRCARMQAPRTSITVNKLSRIPPGMAIVPAVTARLPALAHQLATRHR